jgi:RIO kinase 1
LGDVAFEPEMAMAIYERLIREVVRMLCAGIVHGDLSDFNVLLGADGPVIIDFPQSVDTAHNNNARVLLLRDVDNLHRFLTRFVPNARRMPYAEEMWDLHQKNALTPDTRLTGRFHGARHHANIGNVLGLIDDANRDERKRRDALGLRGGPKVPQSYGQGAPAPRGNAPGAQQSTGTRRGPAPSDVRRPGPVGAPNGNYRRTDNNAARQPARYGAPNNQPPRASAHDEASARNPRQSTGNGRNKSVEVIVLRRPSR